MSLYLFNKILSPAQFTVADNNTTVTLAYGATTIVRMTSTQAITFVGIHATGGNLDGMVVYFNNLNLSIAQTFTFSFAHESGSATAADRMYNPGLATVNGGSNGIGTVSYRYDGAILRWVMIGKSA